MAVRCSYLIAGTGGKLVVGLSRRRASFFFFQAEDGIRDSSVTGVQTCALPICASPRSHAAAPCPIAVKRQMLDWWGPIIHEYYSGTEDIGTAAITPQEWLAHPGSVGRPMDQCHIVGQDRQEGAPRQAGGVDLARGRPVPDPQHPRQHPPG